MNKRHLLVSGLVAAACVVILVLFTDIEHSLGRRLVCSSATGAERISRACRR
jgi:hypothetical protein